MKTTPCIFLVLFACVFAYNDPEQVNDEAKIIDQLLNKLARHKEYVKGYKVTDPMLAHLSEYGVKDCRVNGLASLRKASPFKAETWYPGDLVYLKGTFIYEQLTTNCTATAPKWIKNAYTGPISAYAKNLTIDARVKVHEGTNMLFLIAK